MSKLVQCNFRANEEALSKAREIFKSKGLDLTKALNLFIEKVAQDQSIPFPTSASEQAEATFLALKTEIEKGYQDYLTGEVLNADDVWEQFNV